MNWLTFTIFILTNAFSAVVWYFVGYRKGRLDEYREWICQKKGQ